MPCMLRGTRSFVGVKREILPEKDRVRVRVPRGQEFCSQLGIYLEGSYGTYNLLESMVTYHRPDLSI